MDENELEKQKQDEASQKAAHLVGKGASIYFGGAEGGKLYDKASQTKGGQTLETAVGKDMRKNNPLAGKGMDYLNDKGVLDAADKGLNLATGTDDSLGNMDQGLGLSEGLDGSDGIGNSLQNSLGGLGNFSKPSTPSTSSETESSSDNQEESGGLFDIGGFSFSGNKNKFMIIGIVVGCVFLLFSQILLPLMIMFGPVEAAKKYFSGIWDSVVDFFTKDQQELETEYYEELKKVQQDTNRKSNGTVCIDVNLITASLTVNRSFDEVLENSKFEVEDSDDQFGSNTADDGYDYEDGSASSESENSNFKLMRKQVRLLANMQIVNKKYGLDSALKASTGTYCSNTEEFILVTSENMDNYDGGRYGEIDSSTPELIASHDKTGWDKFWSKKSNEETNYAYYIYHPPFDEDGNCSNRYAKKKIKELSEQNHMELSIGSLADNKESVFYWNLVNSFIPEYYEDYLPKKDDPDYQKSVEKIADDIYLLYKDIGPSQSCGVSFAGPSSLCLNGVTVEGTGTFELEEYVAGVVGAEMYEQFPLESKKALAIAARTYVLNYTNYCSKPILNSSNAQNFTRNYSDSDKQAATETAGMILTYDGSIFSSEYDSWNCKGSNTCTYQKLPSRESHTVTISNKYLSLAAGGHGRGMSQIAAADMANSGSDYKTILAYFYSSGVEITSVSSVGGSGISVANASASEKLNYLFPGGLPASNQEALAYMTTVSVPVVDVNGIQSTKSVTLHQGLAQDFVNIMTEIANSGFPVKSVACYNWRSAAASTSRSHHSYGVACDINPNENYMIKNGQVISGSYWKPGTDPYSIPENGNVVSTFKKFGWIWGGFWNSSKDYMHFSFTGH